MKVLKHKISGRIGETQHGEDVDILIKNAKQHYSETEVEVIDMTPREYNSAIAIQNENDKSPAQKREDRIAKEMKSLNREQAIRNLEAGGRNLT